jgi:hypothetical protein
MMEKKGRGSRRSESPSGDLAGDLKQKRDAFLQTFFRRGAELTEELVNDNRLLRERLTAVEEDNASLKTQLASDRAIRDLLAKIDQLEREKERLLSTVHRQAVITHRFAEVESELESFANLYVASFQLHSTLRPRAVVRNVKELLMQLVGVRSLAIFVVNAAETHLVPIASEGVELNTIPSVTLRAATSPAHADAVIERTFLTGLLHVAEDEPISPPAACIPLQLEDRFIGAIAVYTLLEHKARFVTVDRELFKLLGAHAGGALVAALLWDKAGAQLPSPEALREACT